MFCNQCGGPLQPDYNLCPKCGQPVARSVALAGQSRVAKHVRILGIFWIAVGALWLIPSAVMLTMSRFIHLAVNNNDIFGRSFAPPLFAMLGSIFLLVAAGGICVGWGLMQRQSWARIAAIVLGIIVILHPPFGTALGIYTLWVLLSDDAGREYDQISHAG